jgi:two-component system, OmpR family, response regulator RegX3
MEFSTTAGRVAIWISTDATDSTRAVLTEQLGDAGFLCYLERDSMTFMRAIVNETYDTAIVEWSGTGALSGALVRAIASTRTATGMTTPAILALTEAAPAQVHQAISSGADDFVTKPLDYGQLIGRLRSLAARPWHAAGKLSISLGNIRIDAEQGRVLRDGRVVTLTSKELELASFILERVGQSLSRELIYRTVWGRKAPDNSRTVDSHISSIRRKLRLVPPYGWRLTPLYQFGYRLDHLGNDTAESKPMKLSGLTH